MFTKQKHLKTSKILNLRELRYCKIKVQRRNFSFDVCKISRKQRPNAKKMYYLSSFIMKKSLLLPSPPLSQVVITEIFKVIGITNVHRIISYKYFSWEVIKFYCNISRLNKTRLNLITNFQHYYNPWRNSRWCD